jgi:hypothetical protein
MISQTVVAVRDDRGHGFACARAVGASISHGGGISITAKTPNACGWSGAGRRPSGRPNGARTRLPKPSTPRRNERAAGVPLLRHNPRKNPKLWRRVVTQQIFCFRLLCATGRGAMKRPRSRTATRQSIAARIVVGRLAGYWIGSANGCSAALSKAAAPATESTRPPARAAWPRATRHPQRDATTGTAPVTRLVGRAGPPSMALPRKPPIRDRVFGFDPDLAQQEFQA